MGATCMIIMPFSQISYQWGVVDFWSIPAQQKNHLHKDH